MNREKIYLSTILIATLVGLYFFRKNHQEKNFKIEIRKIDSAHQALRIKLDSLNSKTRERDSILRRILKRNLEIIDTLNLIQQSIAKNKKAIDEKIERSKEVIDEYWKNN